MMKPYIWNPEMTLEEQKNGAYWERNMLALFLAKSTEMSGWYRDNRKEMQGWSRVISIQSGSITFHVPDDFDLGTLQQIEPNWDGHTTESKWINMMEICGCDNRFNDIVFAEKGYRYSSTSIPHDLDSALETTIAKLIFRKVDNSTIAIFRDDTFIKNIKYPADTEERFIDSVNFYFMHCW